MDAIVWDEPKRLLNLEKHKYDFASLRFEFFDNARIYSARGGRRMAIGMFGDEKVTVIFRNLGTQGVSVISMRPASTKEWRLP
jgi:uncharacterized DUF497 family protein